MKNTDLSTTILNPLLDQTMVLISTVTLVRRLVLLFKILIHIKFLK